MKTARTSNMADGGTVETWYDRRSRNWITQTKDAAGNQRGDASYSGDQAGARANHRAHCDEARRELGL